MTSRAPIDAAEAAGLVARRQQLSGPVVPVRRGANQVFRVDEAVIRVAPAAVDVARQVTLARWLLEQGVAVAAPLAEPTRIAGWNVSVWEHVADRGRPIDFEQLGSVAARLHRLGGVELPLFADAPWLALDTRLDQGRAAGTTTLEPLHAAARALGDWRRRARQPPQVVCHGDLHPRNVLMRGDEVVLIDWDAICLGPAAWDHAPLLPWAERYGGPPDAYPAFARGYGADLRDDPLARDLARLRLLAATLNTVLDPAQVAEANARLRYWLGDPDAPRWNAL